MNPIELVVDIAERGGEIIAKTLFTTFILSWPLMLIMAVIYR